MLDENTQNTGIEMPPLDYNPEPAVASQLPPELQLAQQIERESEEVQKSPEKPVIQQAQSSSQQEKEAQQASNFRALKEAAERAARERDEMAARLRQYESQQKVESTDEDLNIKDEDLVEGKHLVKAFKRIKQLEEQQRNHGRQTAETSAELRLRTQFPDFDKVMTLENVQMLSASYPELASSINKSSDLYEKAASAYTIIKKFGIYNEQPFDADKQKALSNSVKPRPLASVSPQQGDSPLTRANAFAGGLTEELKAQLRKEMDEAAKMY